jgi:hypothetical protein
MSVTQPDQDWHTYQQLLQLWQAENPIKTIKLQYLCLTNAVLLAALQLGGGITASNRLLMLGAAVLCLVWTLSIGRTSLFQKAWKNKLDAIAQRHPDDARFQLLQLKEAEAQAPGWLQLLGGVSSKYYLLGTPLVFSAFWLLAAAATL